MAKVWGPRDLYIDGIRLGWLLEQDEWRGSIDPNEPFPYWDGGIYLRRGQESWSWDPSQIQQHCYTILEWYGDDKIRAWGFEARITSVAPRAKSILISEFYALTTGSLTQWCWNLLITHIDQLSGQIPLQEAVLGALREYCILTLEKFGVGKQVLVEVIPFHKLVQTTREVMIQRDKVAQQFSPCWDNIYLDQFHTDVENLIQKTIEIHG